MVIRALARQGWCGTAQNTTGAASGAGRSPSHLSSIANYELALSTVTARRFCDQQEISLHTATGRSLP